MNDDLTQLIQASSDDPGQRAALFARVYRELQSMARRQLGPSGYQGDRTLSTGPLVHEAYLKLFPGGGGGFENRRHFFGGAARAMRQVIVDYARARMAECRNQGQRALNLDDVEAGHLMIDSDAENWVRLDAALEELAKVDERALQVAELRFFSGLEVSEIAEALSVSERTVKRDSQFVRAFLASALES